jgi:hypothetical protein
MGPGSLLYIGIFVASLNPTYQEASDNARRALLETKMMKDEMKFMQDDAERRLYRYTGLKKEDIVYAAYAYPLFAGKVSSKPFKNFKYETHDHFIIRPELEYTFKDGQYTTMLIFIKEF